MIKFFKRFPLISSIIWSAVIGIGLTLIQGMDSIVKEMTRYGWQNGLEELVRNINVGVFIVGAFMVLPFTFTAAEIFLLVKGWKNQGIHKKGIRFDLVGIVLGMFYCLIYLSIFDDVVFGSDWTDQLVNSQTHTPINIQSVVTVAVIALAAVTGYMAVNLIPLKKVPPLALVLGMAAMYLGTIECVICGIQVFRGRTYDFYLLLYPFNCVLLTARTVGHKMWEWDRMMEEDESRRKHYSEGKGFIHGCNRFLANSRRWPLAAFLLMWPLLGILIGILLLFGQRPDAVIKAFTETSDWNLSRRVAPQNVLYDEHYLCTVAAGGHEKIVKPQRLGVRHGHQVIVNRQLCVANAFEQILEERTPRFHRALRGFYDTCGFPVARLIHSQYAADLIYLLMKPLEWIFLAVLYLAETNPENRIAIQYTGKSLEDFRQGTVYH